MLKIAIGGKSRTGKDTVAKIIKRLISHTRIFAESDTHEYTRMLAFATPLYNCMYAVQDALERKHVKEPKLLQTLGEGLRQHYGDNVFMRIVEDEIYDEYDDSGLHRSVIVTDLRYKNEYDMLRYHGFVTIRVLRPDRPIDRDPNHKSEIDLDDELFDYEIVNDGDLDHLELATSIVYDKIKIIDFE